MWKRKARLDVAGRRGGVNPAHRPDHGLSGRSCSAVRTGAIQLTTPHIPPPGPVAQVSSSVTPVE